jgi:hypothetical protein
MAWRSYLRIIMKLTHKQFQQQVIDLARLMGWRHYFTWRSRFSPAGFPDLVLCKPPELVFLELKIKPDKLSPDQAAWLDDLRACGHVAVCCYPEDWKIIAGIILQKEV